MRGRSRGRGKGSRRVRREEGGMQGEGMQSIHAVVIVAQQGFLGTRIRRASMMPSARSMRY